MRRIGKRGAAIVLALGVLPAAPAYAQTVGVRAQGMGGAFTGVADDASAVYWNPAGLASGAYFSGVVDFNALATASDSSFHHQSSATLVSVAMPPLGLSYYRTRLQTTPADRVIAHHVGVTLDQSLWGGLAVGATLEAVHGVFDGGFGSTTFGMHVGAMETGSLGRIGVTIRNLLQPTFDAPGRSARLDRQVRVGGSLNLTDATLVAADADLTRSNATGVERRDAAFGIEQRATAKATLRGGVHWNTSGGSVGLAPEASLGASYAVYGRTSADAQVTLGSKNGDRGWGIGLRMVF